MAERPYREPLVQAGIAFVGMLLVTSLVYAVLWLLDFGPTGDDPLTLVMAPDAQATLTGLGEVTVAVLGVAITVVAIIVELAANRYTPRITELFLRDPFNVVALTFFAVTAVLVLWVDMSLFGEHHPKFMVLAVTAAMTGSLLALLPYFVYVFDFLTPTSVVTRIQFSATDAIRRARRTGSARRNRVLVRNGIEQLGDIALNSVDKKDKAIALSTLRALSAIGEASLRARDRMPVDWFDTQHLTADDHDFAALHPDMVEALRERRTWVEMKIFRQFQSLFGESANRMRDLAHMIAIHSRQLAMVAVETGNEPALTLSLRFLNTYMRASLNARDVRTAYNLFNEYRTLAEQLLTGGREKDAVQMAEWMRFYGQVAFKMHLAFIQETAAYDLCTLIEKAFDTRAPCHDALLASFLELDREPEGDQGAQEASLRGVRKAQIKLATHYLANDAPHYARKIHEDMRHEQPVRLSSIREELAGITEPEYWEVSDRGINFDYLPPERRGRLAEFFSWFEHLDTAKKAGGERP